MRLRRRRLAQSVGLGLAAVFALWALMKWFTFDPLSDAVFFLAIVVGWLAVTFDFFLEVRGSEAAEKTAGKIRMTGTDFIMISRRRANHIARETYGDGFTRKYRVIGFHAKDVHGRGQRCISLISDLTPGETVDSLSHESLHCTLQTMFGPKVTSQLDNVVGCSRRIRGSGM